MNIVAKIHQQAALAGTYAKDGALHSAADILAVLTYEVRKQASLSDAFLASLCTRPEEISCSGHVASDQDPKVCARCGTHIDDERPDEHVVDLTGAW